MLDATVEVLGNKVGGAPIILREFRVLGQCSGKGAFIEGHSRNHTDVQFPAQWKKLVFGRLIENIIDNLNGVDQSCF